jgi:hypothetical protein
MFNLHSSYMGIVNESIPNGMDIYIAKGSCFKGLLCLITGLFCLVAPTWIDYVVCFYSSFKLKVLVQIGYKHI